MGQDPFRQVRSVERHNQRAESNFALRHGRFIRADQNKRVFRRLEHFLSDLAKQPALSAGLSMRRHRNQSTGFSRSGVKNDFRRCAALVAMRPDGRVVAMVGGKNYGDSPFNRVTQARRQPGSAFKLFVYLAAFRAGWTPDSMIEDEPVTIDGWTPVNSDRVYRGQITLREALARSSNAATVRLSEAVGRQNVIRAARDLGISTPLPNKPSLALGTAGGTLASLLWTPVPAVGASSLEQAASPMRAKARQAAPRRVTDLARCGMRRVSARAPENSTQGA